MRCPGTEKGPAVGSADVWKHTPTLVTTVAVAVAVAVAVFVYSRFGTVQPMGTTALQHSIWFMQELQQHIHFDSYSYSTMPGCKNSSELMAHSLVI